jgi:Immunity protein 8
MRPIVRRTSTIDAGDPAQYHPMDPSGFAIVFPPLVGPSPGEGEESFDITVCTPSWLNVACERDGFVVERHHLIVQSYDFDFIRSTLVKLVEAYGGPTWRETAAKVSRIAYWEFEDYRATPD